MSRTTLSALAVWLVTSVSTSSSQTLEKVIYLPDSLPDTEGTSVAFHNPRTNRSYFPGRQDYCVRVPEGDSPQS